MHRIVFILVIFLSSVFSLKAQNKEIKQLYQQRYAQIIHDNNNKSEAIKKDYLSQKALAYAYFQSEIPEKSFDAYSILFEKYPTQVDATDKLYFALVSRKIELYGFSDSLLLNLKSNDLKGQPLFEELTEQFYQNNKDKRSDYWSEFDFNTNYTIKPFPQNSKLGEYGLIRDSKGNCYFSTHKEVGLRKVLSAWFEEPNYSIYKAKYADSSFSGEKELSNTVRSSNQHASYYDEITGFLYITRNAEKPNSKGEKVLQIFGVKQNPVTKAWKEVQFQLNNADFSVSDLVMSPDGSKVIFVSDMPGGFGKSDLYEAPVISNDGSGIKIGEHKNMGPQINSILRENFPRFSDSGDLYFSSDGHLGFGGLDIYTVDKNSNLVLNLGKPVNSNHDDFAAIFHDKWGTLSSNRNSTKFNDNLYFFRWTEDDSMNVTSSDVLVTVIDKNSKKPIKGAIITLDSLDNTDENGNVLEATTDSAGVHLFQGINKSANVKIATHPCGYKFISSSEYTVNKLGQRSILLMVEKYKLGEDLGQLFDVKPIYYESNKYTLTKESKAELDRVAAVLKDNPGLSIELGSHTDSKGNDDYNLKLSNERARSVYQYLTSNGVDKNKLSYKGYGETKIQNRCKNGVTCTEEEHQMNRRTEYVVKYILPCEKGATYPVDVLAKFDKKKNIPVKPVEVVEADTSNKEVADNTEEKEDNSNLNQGPLTCGDADGDKIPDYLDQDSDNDGLPDAAEGKGDADHDGLPNFIDKDSDNDGIADAIEKSVDFDKDGKPNMVDTDSDNDGILDSEEKTADLDKDGNPNYLDLDSDGDGIPDKVEKTGDPDHDKKPNFLDTDSDGDGIPDSVEGTKDTDNDGKPNYLDTDSDGDTIPDSVEGTKDTDHDGKPDYIDTDSDEDGIPDKIEAPSCLNQGKTASNYSNPADKPSIQKSKSTSGVTKAEVVTETKEETPVQSNSAVEYRVQFLMSKNHVSQKMFEDKGLPNVFEYRDGGYYKYCTGKSYKTEEEAQKEKEHVKSLGYADAFVVTFQNGRRIK